MADLVQIDFEAALAHVDNITVSDALIDSVLLLDKRASVVAWIMFGIGNIGLAVCTLFRMASWLYLQYRESILLPARLYNALITSYPFIVGMAGFAVEG